MTRRGQWVEDPGDAWVAHRAAVLRARALPDDRFTRSVEEHGRAAYAAGRCRCAICREAHNEYRRSMRKRDR